MATARSAKPAEDKTHAEAPKVEKKAEPKASASYLDQAAALATDVRALAEGMREELTAVEERIADLNQTTAPEPGDFAAADGVRRIPMSTADVHRALEGLVHAAADLATKTQPAGGE